MQLFFDKCEKISWDSNWDPQDRLHKAHFFNDITAGVTGWYWTSNELPNITLCYGDDKIQRNLNLLWNLTAKKFSRQNGAPIKCLSSSKRYILYIKLYFILLYHYYYFILYILWRETSAPRTAVGVFPVGTRPSNYLAFFFFFLSVFPVAGLWELFIFAPVSFSFECTRTIC